MMIIYIKYHKILLYTNIFNDRGDKNNSRGEKGGALFPQMITVVAIPLEKKKKRKKENHLCLVSVRYILMNPSQNT